MITLVSVTFDDRRLSDCVFVSAQAAIRLSLLPKKSRALRKYSVPLAPCPSWLPGRYWLRCPSWLSPAGEVAGWIEYQSDPFWSGVARAPALIVTADGMRPPVAAAARPHLDTA